MNTCQCIFFNPLPGNAIIFHLNDGIVNFWIGLHDTNVEGGFVWSDGAPLAYLNCNGSPPVGDKPALMTFNEVVTLFHETGHGLQHMLTKVDVDKVAGINGVNWDAVELPRLAARLRT